VTHNVVEAERAVDRLAILEQGRVVAQGTPDELRVQTGQANLEDAFVKAIGSEEGLFA